MISLRSASVLPACCALLAYGCARAEAPKEKHSVSERLVAVAYETPAAPAVPPANAVASGDVRYIVLLPGAGGFAAQPGPDVMCAVEYVVRDRQGKIVREDKAPPLMDYDGFRPALRAAFLGMTAGEIRRVWIYERGTVAEIFDVHMASVWRTGKQ